MKSLIKEINILKVKKGTVIITFFIKLFHLLTQNTAIPNGLKLILDQSTSNDLKEFVIDQKIYYQYDQFVLNKYKK